METLRRGFWDPEDEEFEGIFLDILENHFFEHLAGKGIRYLASVSKGKYVSGSPIIETVELTGPNQFEDSYFDYRFVRS